MKSLLLIAIATLTLPVFATAKTWSVSPNGYQSVVATADQTPKMTLPSEIWSLSPASVPGIFSYVDAKNRADKVREQFGVEDPAQYIASSLGRDIATTLGLQSSDKPSGLASSFASVHFSLRSGRELATSYGKGALVVNVGTLNWFAGAVGKDRYRVSYSVKAQLIDTNTEKVLASKNCTAPLKKRNDAPQLSDMLANNAESLKAELREAADYCVGIFRTELFVSATSAQ